MCFNLRCVARLCCTSVLVVLATSAASRADNPLAIPGPDPVVPVFRYDADTNVTVSSGMVTAWDNDTAFSTGGGGVLDWSGFSGSTVNSVSDGATIFTQSVGFTGAEANSGSTGSALGSTPASFEMWFRPASLGSGEVLWESGGTGAGASLRLDSGGTLTFLTRQSGNTDVTSTRALTPAEISEFHQVIGVVDDTNNETRIYIDGVLEGTTPGFEGWNAGGNGSGLGGIESSPGAGVTGSDFTGEISLFRIFDLALDDDQAFALFNQLQIPPPEIPEPGTMFLFAIGLALFGGHCWRRRSQAAE